MNETQIIKIVIRLATRPKWSIEARRNRVSQMIAEEIQRSDELNQALMELDILLMEDLEAESRCSLAHNHELLGRIDLLLGVLEGIGELIIEFKEQEAI